MAELNYLGYNIPIKNITKEHYNIIKNDLTVTPFVLPDYNYKVESFKLYRRTKNNLILPKYYGIKKYGLPKIINERIGSNINISFNGNVRDYQLSIINDIMNKINNEDSTILSLPCGFGKTVISLYIITLIKMKTLIVVHKTFLMDQWIDRIKQFIPDAKIGIIRQNKVDVENKDIVIAMLQSLTTRKNKYPTYIFDDFHFLIIDECHHICSKTFSEAFFQIGTKKD